MNPIELEKLPPHPALELIPRAEDENPAVKSIVASVCELGRVLETIKVSKGRLVDGRIRIRAAIIAGLDDVATEEVDENEAISVVMHSLLARKHYTASARAILAVPLLQQVIEESQRRSHLNLKSASTRKISVRSFSHLKAQDAAEQLGISRAYCFSANQLLKKLSAHPALRAEWVGKILAGECSLEQAHQGLAGKIAAIDGRAVPKNDAAQLMLALFDTAAARLHRWEQIEPKGRAEALKKFRNDFLPNLPAEFHHEYRRWLREQQQAA